MKSIVICFLELALLSILAGCTDKSSNDLRKKEWDVLMNANALISRIEMDEEDEVESSEGTPHDEFIEWILKDTATMTYSFAESVKQNFVTIATSGDGKMRIYSWDTGMGGSMIWWDNIIQLREGNKVMAYHTSLGGMLHPEDEYEVDYASYIDTIYTVPSSNGRNIYLLKDYFREWSNMACRSLIAVAIENGKLVSSSCFYRDGELSESVGLEHTVSDWYFMANMGEGWGWLFQYDEKNRKLYVPVEDGNRITDRYDIYRWNGTQFVFQGQDGGFWLHPELRSFKNLELLFVTETFRIRIDRMENGTLRYASWDRGEKMSEKPSLILQGGQYDEDSYSFQNGKYIYEVYEKTGENRVVVKYDDEILCDEVQVSE